MTGVHNTVKGEPLKFEFKPCEIHVVRKIKRSVLNLAIE